MDENFNKSQSRLSRTLNVGMTAAENITNQFVPLDKTVVSAPLMNSLEEREIERSLERERLRLEVQREIEKKYELIYSAKLKALDDMEKKYINDSRELAGLLASVKESFNDVVSKEFDIQNNTIALLVLEALYKLIGDNHHYKDYLEKNILDSMSTLTDGIHVKGKLSQYDYDLLVNNSLFEEVMGFISVDRKLTRGQFYLDDGSSIYEAGILDRLDVLRDIFLGALDNNHET